MYFKIVISGKIRTSIPDIEFLFFHVIKPQDRFVRENKFITNKNHYLGLIV